MENQRKCQLEVCDCKPEDGSLYCSEYCQQAAVQAVPRDFCQCAHADCENPAHSKRGDGNLLDPVSSAPGRLTIEYSSFEDLRSQLRLLAQAIDNKPEVVPFQAEATPRRGPSLERSVPLRKPQSA